MAQLHEFQAKRILADHGVAIPRGEVATTAEAAREIAGRLGRVVVKAQIHSTSRAAAGGIKFAESPDEAFDIAEMMLGSEIAGNTVDAVLVDEMLAIEHEFYLGFIIDDRKKRPTLLLSTTGGSGIEERADSMKTLVCSIRREPTLEEINAFVQSASFSLSHGGEDKLKHALSTALLSLYRSAKSCDARTAEINPFVQLAEGRFVAADARISVDDYAVFRHPELGIEMARELGHTSTKLEKIAWGIEKDDFRGTFYFVEILGSVESRELRVERRSEATSLHSPLSTLDFRIGFHGAGGGGSMASLDAAQRNGLAPACYVDTSGNPPASKVYRAAKIILAIPGIRGYFLSGSGVASQEQFGLARAVLKAFLEVKPNIPAVLRLGGNGEDIAKEMVERYARYLPAPVEAYRKRDSADSCAARLNDLIEEFELRRRGDAEVNRLDAVSSFSRDYEFKTKTGTVAFDHSQLNSDSSAQIVASCPQKILKLNDYDRPVLAIDAGEAERGKCSECLACEFASMDMGLSAVKIEFPIEGLS